MFPIVSFQLTMKMLFFFLFHFRLSRTKLYHQLNIFIIRFRAELFRYKSHDIIDNAWDEKSTKTHTGLLKSTIDSKDIVCECVLGTKFRSSHIWQQFSKVNTRPQGLEVRPTRTRFLCWFLVKLSRKRIECPQFSKFTTEIIWKCVKLRWKFENSNFVPFAQFNRLIRKI